MKKRIFVLMLVATIAMSIFAGLFAYTLWERKSDVIMPAVKTHGQAPDISKTPKAQWATRDKLLLLLDPANPKSVFKVVDAIEANPALAVNCHEIGHDLGHRAYTLYGFFGAMNFSDATRLNHASLQDICAGGYVHGVLEEAALYQPRFTDDPGSMCKKLASDSRASCFHGVGHALMFSYHRNIKASLAGCVIAGNSTDAQHCFEGVWMEFFWGDTLYTDSAPLGWDLAQPLLPCQNAPSNEKQACFLYASLGYFRVHPADFDGAIRLCTADSLSVNETAYCLRGIGMTLVVHFKGKNFQQSEPFAAYLTAQQKYYFYKGLLGYALLSGVSGKDITSDCGLMISDRDVCLKALADSL